MLKRKEMASTSDNHAKAPKSAEFVKRMREAFGADQVTVLCVRENDVVLGDQEESIEEYVKRETAKVYA